MKNFEYTIKDEIGIHARPAGALAKEAKLYQSTITIQKDQKQANVTKLMAVMSLGVKNGDTVTITVDGPDEDIAVEKIKEFFENNL